MKGVAGEEGDTGTTGQKVLIINKLHSRELNRRVTECKLTLQIPFQGDTGFMGITGMPGETGEDVRK